ncbi:MAG: hypothetical protein Q9183_001632 [Haloplaca sp. 2 TL-2023]
MAGLKILLASFGMGQYYDAFLDVGFDTWETVLDITESDMESLGVQRGHRRRLQQEIAATLLSSDGPDQRSRALKRTSSGGTIPTNNQKREYNRHPLPDPAAPQRPLSAYVLFSNSVRDEVKDQLLSFAQKSKIVGERWQNLSDASRETWKQLASGPWEQYKKDREQYQLTDAYREHQSYLADFSASQPQRRRKRKSSPESISSQLQNISPEWGSQYASSPSCVVAVSKGHPAPAAYPSSSSTAVSPLKSEDHQMKESLSDLSRISSPYQFGQDMPPQRFSHACESCKKKKLRFVFQAQGSIGPVGNPAM